MSDSPTTAIFRAQVDKLLSRLEKDFKRELSPIEVLTFRAVMLEGITWAYNQALADTMKALAGMPK